jgi:hypothetical protein
MKPIIEDVLCGDCDGVLTTPANSANPYCFGETLLCTACGVLCDTTGQPVKVAVNGSVPQRIYEMAGAVMTEAELLSTVTDEDDEDLLSTLADDESEANRSF